MFRDTIPRPLYLQTLGAGGGVVLYVEDTRHKVRCPEKGCRGTMGGSK